MLVNERSQLMPHSNLTWRIDSEVILSNIVALLFRFGADVHFDYTYSISTMCNIEQSEAIGCIIIPN